MNLEDAEDRRQSMTVACPWCQVEPGEVCLRSDGSELERVAAHTSRLSAAGVVHAPLDSRELRAPDPRH